MALTVVQMVLWGWAAMALLQLASHGEVYAGCQQSTSAFVPWFSRKESP